MLVYDDIFAWEGWGGELRLASGECNLRIYDLEKERAGGVAHLRPMSVRSCTGHIATHVALKFKIDPQRMLYIEYYPETTYGDHQQHIIPEKYDAVEFTWIDGRAIEPKWRTLKSPVLDMIKDIEAHSR